MTNQQLTRPVACPKKLRSILVVIMLLFLLVVPVHGQQEQSNDRPTPVQLHQSPGLDHHKLISFNQLRNSTANTQLRSMQFFPDSVVVYSVQSNPRKFNYLFSNNGELLTTLVRVKQGALWVNESIEHRTYDALGNMTFQQWQAWNGNAWINTSRNIYTYDNNRKILSQTEQNWNAATAAWTNLRRTTNTWSATGVQLSMLKETFAGGNWVNQTFEIYIYENNLLVQAERQTWANGNWANEFQYLYTYDNQANLTSMTMKQWAGNQWNDFYREVFAYDSSNLLIAYVSQLYSSTWQNSEQYFYTYDQLGFPETVQRQIWQNGNWQNSLRRTFSNNNFGSYQLAIHQLWQQNDWVNQYMFTKGFDENGNTLVTNAFAWNNGWLQNQDNQLEVNYNFGLKTLSFQGYKAEAGYTGMLVSTPSAFAPGNVIFPNPSNGRFSIVNETFTSGNLSIVIFAADGKEIFRTNQPNREIITLDISHLGLVRGTYFIRLTDQTNSTYSKLMIE